MPMASSRFTSGSKILFAIPYTATSSGPMCAPITSASSWNAKKAPMFMRNANRLKPRRARTSSVTRGAGRKRTAGWRSRVTARAAVNSKTATRTCTQARLSRVASHERAAIVAPSRRSMPVPITWFFVMKSWCASRAV